jgi:hypothetical protein
LLRGENADHIDKIAHPATTISAFTSELYLKCLLVLLSGKLVGTHNLWKLFNEVEPLTRKRVEELWDAHIWKQDRLRFLGRLEAEIAREPVPRDLGWALRAGSLAFQEARYLYEEPDLKFILSDLQGVLRTVILEICPDWCQ